MAGERCYQVVGQQKGTVEFHESQMASQIAPAGLDQIGRPRGAPGASSVAASSHAAPGNVPADVQTFLAQAQAKYAAAEHAAHAHVAWAWGANVDPAWWVCVGGMGYGPVAFGAVLEWTIAGRIGPNDLVTNGYYGQCALAGTVPGLFQAATILAQALAELSVAYESAKTLTPTAIAESIATSTGTARSESRVATTAKAAPAVPASARPAAPDQVKALAAATGKVQSRAETTRESSGKTNPVSVSPAASVMPIPSIKPDTVTLAPERSARPAAPRIPTRSARPRTMPADSGNQTVLELVKSPKILGGSGIVALAALAWLFMSSGSSARDIERWRDLKQILDDVRTVRAAGTRDFEPLKLRARKIAEDLTEVYKREASNNYPAKQALLFAVRDEIPRMIGGDLTTVSQSEKNFELRLKDAAATLGVD